MTDNQVFNFLSRFASPHDVKILMKYKKITGFQRFFIAFELIRGVPIAKIIGQKWFYGMSFFTNKYTLDPRPDSETLVDAVLKFAPEEGDLKIVDLGTGTGCLICAIVKNLPNSAGTGIDISKQACKVAQKNVDSLGLSERIQIIHDDVFKISNLGNADIVVSNPPYIPLKDKSVDEGAKHDPKLALYAGKDGLKFYRKISEIQTAAPIFLEIGVGQSNGVKKIFESNSWKLIKQYKDLSKRVRVLSFIRK